MVFKGQDEFTPENKRLFSFSENKGAYFTYTSCSINTCTTKLLLVLQQINTILNPWVVICWQITPNFQKASTCLRAMWDEFEDIVYKSIWICWTHSPPLPPPHTQTSLNYQIVIDVKRCIDLLGLPPQGPTG